MSTERYQQLVEDLCAAVAMHDVEHVLETRCIEVEGFDVRLDHFENDELAIYLNFHYGAVTAGRTLVVFRLMLEANLLIYAQDQAQLGLDTDTGGIVLIVRVDMTADLDGEALADLLAHYAEHGRYWQRNILESTDEMFEGIAAGEFVWLRA
ncbi:MAG: CesT family type III secretion system chaperone [Janthinobacterium lividum]